MSKTKFLGTVEELEKFPNLQFVNDFQGVKFIKEYFGNLKELDEFDAFFIETGEGEITKLFGIEGIIPYENKLVWEIIIN